MIMIRLEKTLFAIFFWPTTVNTYNTINQKIFFYTMTTFNIIFPSIPNHYTHVQFTILGFFTNILYFTIFFLKNELLTLNSKIYRGVCQHLFYIDKTPPIPPPYCDIALILRAIILIFPRPPVPRCPPFGSFRENFTRKL